MSIKIWITNKSKVCLIFYYIFYHAFFHAYFNLINNTHKKKYIWLPT